MVQVFWGTTEPESVTQPPLGSTPVLQLEGSLERAIHSPLSHCKVSVQVFCAYVVPARLHDVEVLPRHIAGSLTRSTQTPESHCSVEVQVFSGATVPLSVRHASLGSTPPTQADGSLERATQEPLSHCSVSVHVP